MPDERRGPEAADFDRAEKNGITILTIRGQLVAENSASLKAEVTALEAARAIKVLVDLRPLTYLDSSGVGALMALFKRLGGDKGRVYFAGVKDQPAYILKVVGFDKTLALCESFEDALRKLGPG
jgi:anti-sigma B factor antagonist